VTSHRKPPKVGERFDKLMAVAHVDVVNGNLRWLFLCACGVQFVARVANVRAWARSGSASCADCYRARGGAAVVYGAPKKCAACGRPRAERRTA
jgi:hypothetical protein